MDDTETKLSENGALPLEVMIKRLLFKAERIYGAKYHRFSIQKVGGEVHVVGHEELLYGAEWEHTLCKITELLNGV